MNLRRRKLRFAAVAVLAAVAMVAAACSSSSSPSSSSTAGTAVTGRQNYLKEQGLLPDSFAAEIRPIVAILLPLFTGVVSGPFGGLLQKLSP